MNDLINAQNFTIEDDLLFWQGYLITTSYSELNSQQLHIIQAICKELVAMHMNPEDYFASKDLDSSYFGLVEALKLLKSNN